MNQHASRIALAYTLLLLAAGAARAEEWTHATAWDASDGSVLVVGRIEEPSISTSVLAPGQHAFLKRISAQGEEIWRAEAAVDASGDCPAGGGCRLLSTLLGLLPEQVVGSSLEAVAVDPADQRIYVAGHVLLAWQSASCPGQISIASAAFALRLSATGEPIDSAYFGPPLPPTLPSTPLPPWPSVCELTTFSRLTGESFRVDHQDRLVAEGWLAFDPAAEGRSWSDSSFGISRNLPDVNRPGIFLDLLYAGPAQAAVPGAARPDLLRRLGESDDQVLFLSQEEEALVFVFDAGALSGQNPNEPLHFSFDLNLPDESSIELSIQNGPNSFQKLETLLQGPQSLRRIYSLQNWSRYVLSPPGWENVVTVKVAYRVPPGCPDSSLLCPQSGIAMDSIKIQKPSG